MGQILSKLIRFFFPIHDYEHFKFFYTLKMFQISRGIIYIRYMDDQEDQVYS